MPSTERDLDHGFDNHTNEFGGPVTCSLCGGLCDSVDDYCEGCSGCVCTHCDLNPTLFGSSRLHLPGDHESKPQTMCVACGEDEALGHLSLNHSDLCPRCATEADGKCFTCNLFLDSCRCATVDPDFDSV